MLRITGLTRITTALRRELSQPVSVARKAELQQHVRDTLESVQQILRKNRSTAAHLPKPSQRALHWLRSIDWSAVSISANGQSKPLLRDSVTWPGLSAYVKRMLDRLSQPDASNDIDAIHKGISLTSRKIEFGITHQKVTAAELTSTTRALRGWIAFLADRDNLQRYLQAVRLAHDIFEPALVARRYPAPLRVHFRPTNKLCTWRKVRSGSELHLPVAMLSFGRGGFEVLLSMLDRRDPAVRANILELMQDSAYQSLAAHLESLGGTVDQSAGHTFELVDSFTRVNNRYFEGKMPRPRLTWSKSFTGRKFGHYDFIHDAIMLSRTLDHPSVPAFVVDFIMYHELLHKHHGLKWSNGRSYSHTPTFYADEKRFDQYAEAEELLQKLARGPMAID